MSIAKEMAQQEAARQAAWEAKKKDAFSQPEFDFAAESTPEVLSAKAIRVRAEYEEFDEADHARMAAELKHMQDTQPEIANPQQYIKRDEGIERSTSVAGLQAWSDEVNGNILGINPRSEYFTTEALRVVKPFIGKEATIRRSSKSFYLKFGDATGLHKALAGISERYSQLGYDRIEELLNLGQNDSNGERTTRRAEIAYQVPTKYFPEGTVSDNFAGRHPAHFSEKK